MDSQDLPVSLLNIVDIESDGVHRHFVCFQDSSLAASEGINPRSIVGEFTPGSDGGFDPETFVLNTEFVDAFIQYMNEQAARDPETISEAQKHAGEWLYLIDPRYDAESEAEPPASELLGGFQVDGGGRIVRDSFAYNENHLWVHPETMLSGVFYDRRFYDWLHPGPGPTE